MKSLTLPASHSQACADPVGERGSVSPGKSQVIWVSLEINIRKKLDPLPPGKFWTPSGSFEV